MVQGNCCPLQRLFGRRGGFGRGDQGGEETAPTVGQDLGRLESRGWRRGFTLRLQIHPRLPPPLHPPARPLQRWRDASGRENDRGATCGTCRNGWALRAPMNRANRGPDPATRFWRLPWFGPQRLEDAFYGRIVMTIAFPTHRSLKETPIFHRTHGPTLGGEDCSQKTGTKPVQVQCLDHPRRMGTPNRTAPPVHSSPERTQSVGRGGKA